MIERYIPSECSRDANPTDEVQVIPSSMMKAYNYMKCSVIDGAYNDDVN